MDRAAIFILSIISLLGKNFYFCSNQKGAEPIRRVYVISNLPLVNWDSTIINYDDAYDVFYYKDLVGYRFSYNFDSTVDGELLLHEERNSFFVFQKDSLFGYTYYPRKNPALRQGRIAVDSMMKFTFKGNSYDSLFNIKPDSIYYDTEGNLLKVYNYSATKRYPENFTFYLYYTKGLKGVKETFSKKMDQVKDRKLFRIKTLAHGAYYQEYKMAFPRREILLEMKEMPVENQEELFGYFNRYKNDCVKSKKQ